MSILSLLLLTMLSYALPDKERILESLSMDSRILDCEVKYSVVLPEAYFQRSENYPVVYLLHGLGDDEKSWLEYGRISQYADRATEEGEIVPMIFIIPQGFRSYYVNDFDATFRYQDMFTEELIPFIDSTYRTKKGMAFRATMGYSMGGFGALILPLKHPELFGSCVPLSVSVRTDEQYMSEDASGWDEQWGRLFGAKGSIGEARLTDYYKENSPFHILEESDAGRFNNLRIYLDRGDDEQTLAYSNEGLHRLMREKQLPHEYRVRNGGHSFSYWQEAIPNGLRFISDAFEGKAYRGDQPLCLPNKVFEQKLMALTINGISCELSLPAEYAQTTRNYPVIYVIGEIKKKEKRWIAGLTASEISAGKLPPMILVFVPQLTAQLYDKITPKLESQFRIRKGYRFHALIGVGNGGTSALRNAMNPLQFTSCSLLDTSSDYEVFQDLLQENREKDTGRTWFYLASPDKGAYYRENGLIHLDLKTAELYHEYRIIGGEGGLEWRKKVYYEALDFTAKKIHR